MINSVSLKKIVSHYTINTIMVIFLVVNLFPIFWMIYNSFKGNTEIMSGNVGLKKSENTIIYLNKINGNLFVGSSDGAITKINDKSKKIDYYSLKSLATNFWADKDSIWVVSSDKGLVQLSNENLGVIKRITLPNKALPTVEMLRNKPFTKVVDVAHIGQITITGSDQKLWMAAEGGDIRTVMEYDRDSGAFSFIDIPDHFKFDQIKSLQYDKHNNLLWIGTDGVFIRHDLKDKGFTFLTVNLDYMPPGSQGIRILSPKEVLLQTATGLYLIDSKSTTIIKKYFKEDDITSDQEINSLDIFKDNFYVGTNSGLIIVNKVSGLKENKEALFSRIINGQILDKNEMEASELRSTYTDGASVIIGASSGRVSVYDAAVKTVIEKVQSREGHVLMFSSGWRNYVDMWPNVDFWKYLKNSVVICGFTMIIAMILATMTAYALVRFKFPGVKLFSNSILVTQMIPAILYLIPMYMLFNIIKDTTAGMEFFKALFGPGFNGIMIKGSYLGLIFIYSAWFLPFSIWILRGFFAAIPVELEEAATIDGCSNIGVFLRITLPLAIPGIIATGIFILIQAWDELMFAWMLTSDATQTLPVGIRLFVGNFQNRFDLMMAAATVATIPVLILFFVLQKHIVRGLTAGAVKG